jgi:hypothetical protein
VIISDLFPNSLVVCTQEPRMSFEIIVAAPIYAMTVILLFRTTVAYTELNFQAHINRRVFTAEYKCLCVVGYSSFVVSRLYTVAVPEYRTVQNQLSACFNNRESDVTCDITIQSITSKAIFMFI